MSAIYSLLKTIWQMQPFNTQYFLGHHLYAHNLYNIDDDAVILGFIGKSPPDLAEWFGSATFAVVKNH